MKEFRDKVPDVAFMGHHTVRQPDMARKQEVKRQKPHTL